METINVKIENLSSEKQEQLRALVAEANKPKRWKPQTGERFYYLDGSGDITESKFSNGQYAQDCARFRNCYRSQEEAEFAREKALVLADLQTYADEHNEREIDWKDDKQRKWIIINEYQENRLGRYHTWGTHFVGGVYFTSDQIARDAIKSVGEARIKKYLFGVES